MSQVLGGSDLRRVQADMLRGWHGTQHSYRIPRWNDQNGTAFLRAFPVVPVAILGGVPLVAVMEAADLWNRKDAPSFRSLNRSRLRRILGQRQVRPRLVVIRHK